MGVLLKFFDIFSSWLRLDNNKNTFTWGMNSRLVGGRGSDTSEPIDMINQSINQTSNQSTAIFSKSFETVSNTDYHL
jgi:hypothetical protein